jgi:hypothetical protein
VAEERWAVDCDAALEREPREAVDRSMLLLALAVTGLVGLLGVEWPGWPSLVRFLLRKPRACIKRSDGTADRNALGRLIGQARVRERETDEGGCNSELHSNQRRANEPVAFVRGEHSGR